MTIRKPKIKASNIAIYASVFVLLIAIIAVGYRAPERSTNTSTANANATVGIGVIDQPTYDNIVAADLAANLASATNLSVAPEASAYASLLKFNSTLVSNIYDTKPPIVELSSASRNITQYAVKAGDTVDSVAAKFGISADTVKWANNLSSNTLTVGSSLKILPRNGIIYVVKAGDTVQSIADKYKSNANLITTYNDLDVSGLTTGLQIIVPNGILPENERPGYVDYTVRYGVGFSGTDTWYIKTGTRNAGNYGYGQCVAYAYDRRIEMGLRVGANWGNAAEWAWHAINEGYRVDNIPSVGAIMQNGGGYGHVAIVEKVNSDGSIEISEMNAYVAGGGWNVVSGRTVPAASVGLYAYIH